MSLAVNNKIVICAVLIIITLACGCISQSDSQQPDSIPDGNIEDIRDIEGIWTGDLEVPGGTQLGVLFNFSLKPDDSVSATMDSLDQGVTGIPVETVDYSDGNLRMEVKSIGGVFEGTFQEDGNTIEGEWKQSSLSLTLVLSRIDEMPDMSREQDPVRPYPYDEEEVVYENKEAGIKLAGTLTLPESEIPAPAVILISGSGAQNRDEEIFNHRPFLVLSDYLTLQGIAVLRVDDRGVGGSTGSISQSTSEDFAGDVLAGIEYLKSRDEIDPTRVGLIGHSEGGIIAPMVAVQSDDVAFIVLMAGTGLKGEEIILLQTELIARSEGASDDDIEQNKAFQKSLFSVVKEEEDNTIASEKLRKLMIDEMENMSEEEIQNSGYSETYIETQIISLTSPWVRFFLTYEPKPALMEVKCPVLAINGEKDFQVPSEENLRAIEEALEAGVNTDYTVKELPELNHLFQTAETGSPSEYASIEETISPDALELIGDWIVDQTQESGV